MSALGHKQTCATQKVMSALCHKQTSRLRYKKRGCQSGATSKKHLRLVWHTLNDERTRLCGFVSYCADFFEVFRIVEGLCFLDAVERISYETLRRCSAIECGYFAAAGDVVAA